MTAKHTFKVGDRVQMVHPEGSTLEIVQKFMNDYMNVPNGLTGTVYHVYENTGIVYVVWDESFPGSYPAAGYEDTWNVWHLCLQPIGVNADFKFSKIINKIKYLEKRFIERKHVKV